MGDPESDEHLRIFKCLVDTGSDVLRYTVERKMLVNTSFEQYLNQNKHKFYHQFEKRRYKPCCPGNPHNCVVKGIIDKKTFFKMYNKKAELDTHDCLDRFEVNADISLDKLDLSDLNFFLWNSATLSPQEEQSLQAIMSTRSAICHSSSSRKYSLDELENFWLSLKNDLLLFAEPYHYKKSIEREITTLRNCSLSKIESKKVIDKMKKLFHEIKLETETKNKSMENQMKKGNEGLKDCFRLENNSIKTHINEKMHEILETEMRTGKRVAQSQTQLSTKMEEEAHETRRQFETGFKQLLGVIGKQNITLGINMEQREELIESPVSSTVKIENVVKTSESFAEKYQSAIDKTYDDSKSVLKNDDINSYDHEVLSTVLINSEKTEDNVIQYPDLSRILQDSPMIIKQFCELFSVILADANVWIGVKCTCDTTIHNQYEGVPCRKGDCTIVIEKDDLDTSDFVFPNQFLGLKTLYVNTTASRDNETATIAKKMMEFPCRSPNKVPGTVAKELFKQHSNLTMVCPSNFKSTGFNSKNAELHGINCIQLFCKIKGIIPIGESHFPSAIDGVTTDVLEGTSQFSSVVHIGDKIYNEQDNTGTLGGFVKYYGIDTFLTCSHVIFGKNDFFKLQNKDIHFKCHTISNKDVPEPVECVLIRHSLKYDQQEKDMQVDAKTADRSNLQDNPDETSIDAALLLIETPNKTKSSVSRNLLTSRSASAVAGTSRSKTNVAELTIKLYGGIDSTQSSFSEYGLDSIYLNDNVLDPEGITSRALSLSAFSGKQEKHVTIHKEKEILIPIPAHVRTRDNIIMYNQITLRNMEFQAGDSGTCIYGKCLKSGKKGCIGMFIGKCTSGQYIITPMKDILDALGVKNMP